MSHLSYNSEEDAMYAMYRHCPRCGWFGQFVMIREFTDPHGRRWEVYQCGDCGHKLQYAVT